MRRFNSRFLLLILLAVIASVDVSALAQSRDLYEDKNKFELEEATAKYLAQQQARLSAQWHPPKTSKLCIAKFTADIDKSGRISNVQTLQSTSLNPKAKSIAKLMDFPPPPEAATPLSLYLYFFKEGEHQFVNVGTKTSPTMCAIYSNGEDPIVARLNPYSQNGEPMGTYAADLQRELVQVWQHSDMPFNSFADIGFVVDRSGNISNIKVIRSSGSGILESSARKALEKASPVREVPGGLADDLNLTVKFNDKLVEYGTPHPEPDQHVLKPYVRANY